MFGHRKGPQFDRLRKLLRDKTITTMEYRRLANCESNFAGVIQHYGWRKTLKAIYQGYYAIQHLYWEIER
jgi:hypothetical protein